MLILVFYLHYVSALSVNSGLLLLTNPTSKGNAITLCVWTLNLSVQSTDFKLEVIDVIG